MTNRERWVIYPLLMFSLGLGLRDKLFPQGSAEFGSLRCRELTVVSETDLPVFKVFTRQDGVPVLQMHGPASAEYVAATQAAAPAERDSVAPSAGTSSPDTPSPNTTGAGDEAFASGREDTMSRRLMEVSSNASGAFLRLFGPPEMPALLLGHDAQLQASGLLGEDAQGHVWTAGGGEGSTGGLIPGALISWASGEYVPEPSVGPNANENNESRNVGDAENAPAADRPTPDRPAEQEPPAVSSPTQATDSPEKASQETEPTGESPTDEDA